MLEWYFLFFLLDCQIIFALHKIYESVYITNEYILFYKRLIELNYSICRIILPRNCTYKWFSSKDDLLMTYLLMMANSCWQKKVPAMQTCRHYYCFLITVFFLRYGRGIKKYRNDVSLLKRLLSWFLFFKILFSVIIRFA